MPVEIKYICIPNHDNEEKLRKVYFRLFNLAKTKFLEERRKKEYVRNEK